MKKTTSGFTIVELLIVIVVIGILAAISVVAYNGIQKRAEASKVSQDLSTVNKAIQAYYAINNTYPTTNGQWFGYVGGTQTTTYVPNLVPEFISSLPQPRNKSPQFEYIYNSDGTNYKLIAHDNVLNDNQGFETTCPLVSQQIRDPVRNCWAVGYWNPGGSGY